MMTPKPNRVWRTLCPILQPGPVCASARYADGAAASTPQSWRSVGGGVTEIGHTGAGFAYDNEGPRHRVYLEDFEIADYVWHPAIKAPVAV